MVFLGQGKNSIVDVVADEPHPLDALDATFGRLVGVPVLDPDAVGNVDLGLGG